MWTGPWPRRGRLRRVAPRRPARARPRAARDGPPPGRLPRRAGLDRRHRRRQPGTGTAQRRGHGGRATRLLRRPGHRDEGRVGADGAGGGQLLGARAARRRGPHHPVQPPVHVLRGQARLGPGGRQRGHRQAARAGAAVRAADRRTGRRPVPARGLLGGDRRRRDRGGAGQPPRGGQGGADRQRERGPGGDAGRGRPHQARPARAGRQERADRLRRRRSRRGRPRGRGRHELRLVRPVLRLDQPRLPARRHPRRGARPGPGRAEADQAGAARGPGHHHGRAGQPGPPRPGARLHRPGPGRGRAAGRPAADRRPSPGWPAAASSSRRSSPT